MRALLSFSERVCVFLLICMYEHRLICEYVFADDDMKNCGMKLWRMKSAAKTAESIDSFILDERCVATN